MDATALQVDDDELPRNVVIATMAGVIAALFLGALDQTIVGTAMPRIISELHGFEHYASVTTVYMVAATVVVPIAGKLSDIFGRKPFLLAGVAIFVVASLLCGAATSMTQLVVFRGLQGIGGGFSQAMAFTTVADLFPPARRGKIAGLMGGVFGLSSVIGPALGGFLTDGPGWRWCFWVNLPVGLVAFAVLLFAFPARAGRHQRSGSVRIDWLGALTLVAATVPLLLALSWGGRERAWGSPTIVAMLFGGVVLAVVFVLVERRASAPIIPPALFRNPIVRASAIAATLVAVAMFGTLMFIPLFVQAVIGTSATKSGTVMTPMMFAMIGASIVAGQVMTRAGRYKAVAVVGVSIVTLGMALLTTTTVSTSYGTVLAFMMVVGVGLGTTMPVFNLAVQNAVDLRDVGVATSSLQFLRSMGGAIGGAVFGAVVSTRFPSVLDASLTPDVTAHVPAEMLGRLHDPQLLMNPAAVTQLRGSTLLSAMQEALASSLHTVFVASTAVAALAVLATCFLPDATLRKTRGMAPPSA